MTAQHDVLTAAVARVRHLAANPPSGVHGSGERQMWKWLDDVIEAATAQHVKIERPSDWPGYVPGIVRRPGR